MNSTVSQCSLYIDYNQAAAIADLSDPWTYKMLPTVMFQLSLTKLFLSTFVQITYVHSCMYAVCTCPYSQWVIHTDISRQFCG